MSYCNHHNNKNKNKFTIVKISIELWDRISNLLPSKKPKDTVGRHVIPFRKVMDGIIYVLRIKGCQ